MSNSLGDSPADLILRNAVVWTMDSSLPRAEAVAVSPWRTFADLGDHLCFGTDWGNIDLQTPDPLAQIFAAVTRIPPQITDGRPMAHPELCLTIEPAIRGYTLEGAYAEFMEDRKGSISPGKLADLCALSENILEVDPRRIPEAKVDMTVFDGEVVFEQL